MTPTLEDLISKIDTLEEFERKFTDEFLNDDDHVGNYLRELLWKYDKKDSVVSNEARLHHSYVGNIVAKPIKGCFDFHLPRDWNNSGGSPIPAEICRPRSALCPQKTRCNYLVWLYEEAQLGRY